jgi:DNA-binding transcriptional LysR family regulator
VFAWDDLRHFLAVHREGNLSAAARALKVDQTTVGRRIAALEAALGARLFERTAGGFTLSEAGEAVLAQARRMEEAASAARQSVWGAEARVRGPVRLTTPEALGSRFVAPRLPALVERYPELELELLTDARVLDLGRGEADLALRMVEPTQGHLVGRRLGTVRSGLYASARYLEAHGAPPVEGGWSGHRVILSGAPGADLPDERWVKGLASGARVALRTFSINAQVAAAAAGVGIAALPCYLADAVPELRRLLPGQAVERDVWLALRKDLRRTARVRVVADFLADLFARHEVLLRGELGTAPRRPTDGAGSAPEPARPAIPHTTQARRRR